MAKRTSSTAYAKHKHLPEIVARPCVKSVINTADNSVIDNLMLIWEGENLSNKAG